jgi:hypothetical protein
MTGREKIRALLAKTVANGCTPAEALAAADKARELLRLYGLTMNDLVAAHAAPVASVAPRSSQFRRPGFREEFRRGDLKFKAMVALLQCAYFVVSIAILGVVGYYGIPAVITAIMTVFNVSVTVNPIPVKSVGGDYHPNVIYLDPAGLRVIWDPHRKTFRAAPARFGGDGVKWILAGGPTLLPWGEVYGFKSGMVYVDTRNGRQLLYRGRFPFFYDLLDHRWWWSVRGTIMPFVIPVPLHTALGNYHSNVIYVDPGHHWLVWHSASNTLTNAPSTYGGWGNGTEGPILYTADLRRKGLIPDTVYLSGDGRQWIFRRIIDGRIYVSNPFDSHWRFSSERGIVPSEEPTFRDIP